VELLRQVHLTVPETTELLYELNREGYDLPLDALSVDECAQALRAFLEA
jgi:energy-coupling factor transport system ATP-binding protein